MRITLHTLFRLSIGNLALCTARAATGRQQTAPPADQAAASPIPNSATGSTPEDYIDGTLGAALAERLEAIVRGRCNRLLSNSNAEGLNYLQPFGDLNLAAAVQNGFITPARLGTIFNGSATPATQAAAGAARADLTTRYLHPASYPKFHGPATAAKTSLRSGLSPRVANTRIGK